MKDQGWLLIWHWTAGADGVNDVEEDSYHFIVSRDAQVFEGDFKPEDNLPPLERGKYAAHTLNCNTRAISVAFDAMAGAQERPFNAGKYPITAIQLLEVIELSASICLKYNIPVSRSRTLTHAEVQPTLGIKQKNKWDITWLPGMVKPGDPLEVGDQLRAMLEAEIRQRTIPVLDAVPKKRPDTGSTRPSSGGFFLRLWRALFGG